MANNEILNSLRKMRPIIKRESHGYVKPDGNPMTGGAWFSITFLAHKFIPVESLTADPDVVAWLKDFYANEAVFVVAYITSGYDKSTNYEGVEVEEWFDEDDFNDVIEECSLLTQEEKTAIWNKLDELANDPDGYTPYDE